MPGNKNDNSHAAAGILGAGFLAVLAFLFGLLVLIAIAVSLVYLVALISGKPVTLFGDTYHPRDALPTYRNGIIGIAVILTVTAFICGFYGLSFPKDWLIYLVAGGYSAGSLWLFLLAGDAPEQTPSAVPAQPTLSPRTTMQAINPFEYASWDDERNAP